MNKRSKRNTRYFIFYASLAWMTLATGALYSQESQVYLVENGQPRAEIVIAPNAPRTVQMAAKELQSYFKKMSNAELPIVTEKRAGFQNHIYVGQSEYVDKLGIKNSDLKDGAFRMVSGDDWLVFLGGDVNFEPKEPWCHSVGDEKRVLDEWDAITGEHFANPYSRLWRRRDRKTGLWEYDLDNAGSFNAVNQFLRDLGVRWYMPGELGEIVPTLTSIKLPKINKTVKPDFPYRDIYIYGSNFFSGKEDSKKEDLIWWQMRLGLNQGLNIFGCIPDTAFVHGVGAVVARDEMKAAHPDFYKLEKGKRLTEKGVPCLSSEELVQANVRYLRALFDHYDIKIASVMPTDGFVNLCGCEKCKGKIDPEKEPFGQLSDYVWGYVNRVAQEIYKTHPDRKIQCAAYTSYLLPPEKIDKLSPNLMVGIATEMPKTSELYKGLIRDWRKKMSSDAQIYQYDYYLRNYLPVGEKKSPWEGVPAIFPEEIVENLRATKGISIGDYIEVYPNILNDINVFVASRFLWDVNQDLGAIMEEYYKRFYGPASEQMKAFIKYAEVNWISMTLELPKIDLAFKLIFKAREAAGDTIYGKRIDRIISFMEPMKGNEEYLSSIPIALTFNPIDAVIRIRVSSDEHLKVTVQDSYLGSLQPGEQLSIAPNAFEKHHIAASEGYNEFLLFLKRQPDKDANVIGDGWEIDYKLSKRLFDGKVYLWTFERAKNTSSDDTLVIDHKYPDEGSVQKAIQIGIHGRDRWQGALAENEPQTKLKLLRPFMIPMGDQLVSFTPYEIWSISQTVMDEISKTGSDGVAFLEKLLMQPSYQEKFEPLYPFPQMRSWKGFGSQQRTIVQTALVLHEANIETRPQQKVDILRPIFELPHYAFSLGYSPEDILAMYMDRALSAAEMAGPKVGIPFLQSLLQYPQFQETFSPKYGPDGWPRIENFGRQQRIKIIASIARLQKT